MKYYKTIFTITSTDEDMKQAAREVLADDLAECGYEAFEDTEEGIIGYVQQEMYHQDEVKSICENFLIPVEDISFITEEIEDQDWNAAWEEEGFEPIVIKDLVTIYDARHTEDYSLFTTPMNIGIHATNAFGTGTHETTRMMVETILELSPKNKRVLDCGTGTGILAITAAKCGALVTAYDIDEFSADNAQHNAQLNCVENQIRVLLGDASVLSTVNEVFDIVLANINRNILLADMETFVGKMAEDASLVLSGFYEEDIPLLLDKAKSLGIKELRRKKSGDWCCLVLTR